jgi:hypothetical protein
MNHVETANIESGRYVYDVEILYNASNTIQRVVEGIVTVNSEVTY